MSWTLLEGRPEPMLTSSYRLSWAAAAAAAASGFERGTSTGFEGSARNSETGRDFDSEEREGAPEPAGMWLMLVEGEEEVRIERGRDCEVLPEMVEPWARTAEASGEAAERWACWSEVRLLGSFFVARGESLPIPLPELWEWWWEAELGVAPRLLLGELPMMASVCVCVGGGSVWYGTMVGVPRAAGRGGGETPTRRSLCSGSAMSSEDVERAWAWARAWAWEQTRSRSRWLSGRAESRGRGLLRGVVDW